MCIILTTNVLPAGKLPAINSIDSEARSVGHGSTGLGGGAVVVRARIPVLTRPKCDVHLLQVATVDGMAEGVVGLAIGATHLLSHLLLTLATLIS